MVEVGHFFVWRFLCEFFVGRRYKQLGKRFYYFLKGELKEKALTVKNRGGDLKVIIDVIKDGINAVYLEGKAEVDCVSDR